MLKQLALYSIFGKPAVVYGGMLTLILFLFAALVPIWNGKQEKKIPFYWHTRLAKIAITVGIIHAIFALSLFF